jgi:hypothetical protein
MFGGAPSTSKIPIQTETVSLYISFLAQIGQSRLGVFCKSIEYKKYTAKLLINSFHNPFQTEHKFDFV